MSANVLLRSFAAGEITPEMYGRIDLAKRQTGLALAKNMEITPHGPAQGRAGLTFVNQAKFSGLESALIPFTFSNNDSYALEFGHGYIRVHTNGGTLLETAKSIVSISQGNPAVIGVTAHGWIDNDWVFLSGIGGMTQLEGRFAKIDVLTANTFSIRALLDDVDIDSTNFAAFTAGGTVAKVFEIPTTYDEADVMDLHYTQSEDVLTIVHQNYPESELRRSGPLVWALTPIVFTPTIPTPAAPNVTIGAGTGSVTYEYVTTAIAEDGLEESLASPPDSVTNNLATAGNFNNIAPAAVADAIRYNVYRLQSGLYGYIGQTDGSTFRDDNFTPRMDITPPELKDPFPDSEGDHPRAVGYFDGRRCFAGSTLRPQNVAMTKSGTESNMTYSIPTRANDAIFFRIKSQKANTIRHLVPLSDLIMLTNSAEWRVTSINSDAITPDSISFKAQSYVGANNVQPILTDASILFAQDRGGRVREMTYTTSPEGQVVGYKTDDVSILAPHLFDAFDIRSIAYARSPTPIGWFVRSDGALLGLTYVPEHEVRAWHQHHTDGWFKSVCAVVEDGRDSIYAIVERMIDGNTVKYIERKRARFFTALEDAFFVDSGVTYTGAPITTIRNGLWHLEGQTVAALADGVSVPPRVVTNGTITLDAPASKVHIGLPYNQDFVTLPIAGELQAGGQGRNKNNNAVHIRVTESSNVKAGPSFDKLRPFKQRTNEPYGEPPRLINGEIEIVLTQEWGTDGKVCIRQDEPLPLTVVSLAIDTAFGG